MYITWGLSSSNRALQTDFARCCSAAPLVSLISVIKVDLDHRLGPCMAATHNHLFSSFCDRHGMTIERTRQGSWPASVSGERWLSCVRHALACGSMTAVALGSHIEHQWRDALNCLLFNWKCESELNWPQIQNAELERKINFNSPTKHFASKQKYA